MRAREGEREEQRPLVCSIQKKRRNKIRNLWLWLVCCSLLPTCCFYRPFTTVTYSSVRYAASKSVHHCNVQQCQTRYQPVCSSLYRTAVSDTLPTSLFITVEVMSSLYQRCQIYYQEVCLQLYQRCHTTKKSVHHCTSGVSYITDISVRANSVIYTANVCPSLYQRCQIHY